MPVKVEINGKIVEFEKVPTPEDVDYVANQLGISKTQTSQTPEKPKMPLLTKADGGLGTAIKDVSTGALKSLIRGGRDVANLAQKGGKAILSATGVDTSQMGINSIDDDTPEGKQVSEQLKSKSRGEQVGTALETIAELGTGFLAKGPQKVATKIAEKGAIRKLEKVANITADVADKQSRINALKATGKTIAGKEQGVKKSLITRTVKEINTPQDLERAKNVSEFVTSKNPLKNIARLNKGIEDISQKVIIPNLDKNPRMFNMNILNKKLASQELPMAFKSDPVLRDTYNLVRETMSKIAAKHPKTTKGLWEARKEFDELVKRDFGDLAFGDPKRNLVKRAIQDVRRNVNDFIGSQVGDGVFKANMKKLNYIYDSIDNIAENHNKLINSSAMQRLFSKYPRSFKVLGWGAAAVAGKNLILDPLSSDE